MSLLVGTLTFFFKSFTAATRSKSTFEEGNSSGFIRSSFLKYLLLK